MPKNPCPQQLQLLQVAPTVQPNPLLPFFPSCLLHILAYLPLLLPTPTNTLQLAHKEVFGIGPAAAFAAVLLPLWKQHLLCRRSVGGPPSSSEGRWKLPSEELGGLLQVMQRCKKKYSLFLCWAMLCQVFSEEFWSPQTRRSSTSDKSLLLRKQSLRLKWRVELTSGKESQKIETTVALKVILKKENEEKRFVFLSFPIPKQLLRLD